MVTVRGAVLDATDTLVAVEHSANFD